MSSFFDISLALVRLEEDCKLKAYKDTEDVWTIGWGYNLPAHGFEPDQCEGMVWTQAQADEALVEEVEAAVASLDRLFPTWRNLDIVRQVAVVSSMYQLGAGKAVQFKETIKALKAHDWEQAAQQMLASRWARQTPARVNRNAAMIRSGKWPDEVNGKPFHPDGTETPPVATEAKGETIPPDAWLAVKQGNALAARCAKAAASFRESDVTPQQPSTSQKAQAFIALRVSKKMTMAILGLGLVLCNGPLNLGLTPNDLAAIKAMVVAFIISQAGVDAVGPQAASILSTLRKRFGL